MMAIGPERSLWGFILTALMSLIVASLFLWLLVGCAVPQRGALEDSKVAYANPDCWRNCSVSYLIVRAAGRMKGRLRL